MNCLLIHSMEVNSNEDTDKLVLDVIHDDLEINVRKLVIDRTHRIGDPKKKKVKLSPYNSEICQLL